MSNPRIYFFVKTFKKQEYAAQFLDGLLHMNTLGYFVKLEEGDNSGRGDRYEGVAAWLQPNEIQLQFNGVLINSPDLAGPVSIQMQKHLVKNVFCMHASYIGGNIPSEFESTEKFEEALKIPQENISLGQISVAITNVEEFFNRVKAAAKKQNVALASRLVNYYDPNVFHGHFSEEEAPFNKQIKFFPQREYRIVINRQNTEISTYELNVGNLRDIASEVSIEAINSGIKISPTNKFITESNETQSHPSLA